VDAGMPEARYWRSTPGPSAGSMNRGAKTRQDIHDRPPRPGRGGRVRTAGASTTCQMTIARAPASDSSWPRVDCRALTITWPGQRRHAISYQPSATVVSGRHQLIRHQLPTTDRCIGGLP
jgi:hypothetical protein